SASRSRRRPSSGCCERVPRGEPARRLRQRRVDLQFVRCGSSVPRPSEQRPPIGQVDKGSPSRKTSQAALTLAALGAVFGDIGTSPRYAVKQTFSPDYGIPFGAGNIMGGLSTIFWSLVIVVSLKYVVLVMRADNRGEGGSMALLALASAAVRERPQLRQAAIVLGLLAGALFYGETVLPLAISVVSACCGLRVAR